MALDKLVDSTQLDSGLTSVANAIRAKSGGSSQLAFPAGFVSAVQAIPTGTGYTIEQIASNEAFYEADLVLPSNIEEIAACAFYGKGISKVSGSGVKTINAYAFEKSQMTAGPFEFDFPNVETIYGSYAFGHNNFNNKQALITAYMCGGSIFEGGTNLPSVKYTRATKIDADQFYNVNSVQFIIINSTPNQINSLAFRRSSSLTDIYVPWSEGAVENAPWGATGATIHYNTVFDANGDPVV